MRTYGLVDGLWIGAGNERDPPSDDELVSARVFSFLGPVNLCSQRVGDDEQILTSRQWGDWRKTFVSQERDAVIRKCGKRTVRRLR